MEAMCEGYGHDGGEVVVGRFVGVVVVVFDVCFELLDTLAHAGQTLVYHLCGYCGWCGVVWRGCGVMWCGVVGVMGCGVVGVTWCGVVGVA